MPYMMCSQINKIELNSANFVQICVFTFGSITLRWFSYLHLCHRVRYVCFPHNLSILAKNNPISSDKFPPILSKNQQNWAP